MANFDEQTIIFKRDNSENKKCNVHAILIIYFNLLQHTILRYRYNILVFENR
jgi:hypothetical protein